MIRPYSIRQITLRDLKILKSLLDLSAGYDCDIAEESFHFEKNKPQNWFYAEVNSEPVAFIRAFPQNTWGNVELYNSTTNLDITKDLIASFNRASSFPAGFRLRFEISADHEQVINIIKDLGYTDRVEHFLHYELNLEDRHKESPPSLLATTEDAEQAQKAFENLHPVTTTEVQAWINYGGVYVHSIDSQVASAAQVYEYGDTAEINRVGTSIMLLKRGAAFKLLSGVHSALATKGIEKVFLKVHQEKLPARSLYVKLGYAEVPSKAQVWLSKFF